MKLQIGVVGAIACGVLSLGLNSTARADIIEQDVIYELQNHPAGTSRPPLYGLRLDELEDVTAEHDIFTFDFEHEQSDMRLVWDGEGIRIYGVAFGGLDIGSEYDPDHSGLWEIDFTYSEVGTVPGDDDLIVTTPNYTNTGSIRFVDGGDEVPLWDYAGHHGYTFRLGDENDDEGHRGFEGVSGWGWLNHTEMTRHTAASDWIFTVGPPIPAPGAAAMALLGAGFIGARRRRRA